MDKQLMTNKQTEVRKDFIKRIKYSSCKLLAIRKYQNPD